MLVKKGIFVPIVSIDDIFPGSVLKEDLYHIESGKLLLQKGEMFSDEKIQLLESLSISSVFRGVSGFEISDFLQEVNYKAINLDSSMKGKVFSSPLYDRKKRILVEANVPLNESFMRSIEKSGGVVYQVKPASEINSKIADEFLSKVAKITVTSKPSSPEATSAVTLEVADIQKKKYGFDESAEIIADGIKISSDFVDNDLAQRKKPQKVEVTSNGALLEMGVKDPLVKRTENYKSTFNDTYLELIKELSILFKNIAENSSGKIDNHVKTICSRVVNTLVADKNLVINLTNLRDKNDDYLVQHSLNVAIFSINIACSIGYNEKQIFELAFGALLSDIGMMKINKDLLAKKGILNSEERRAIERHPAFSLDYLNYIKGIPTSLPYIIYQSHEKLDGTGYPKGRPSFLIHEFAKIIAIADMFDSLCSDRPWRKALIPYKAMEEIIRMAGQKKIDGKIIRQWLFSISLFPVGSYVSLNDTSVAKVISSNPSDFTRPNLRAMSKDGANLSEPATIVLGDNKALRITHAVSQSEVQFGVLDGF